MSKDETKFRASILQPWEKDAAASLRKIFDDKSNLSQKDFAKAAGIGSAGMVSQYLNGKRPIGLPAAVKFARLLGVTAAEISPVFATMQAELQASGQAVTSSGADPITGLPSGPLDQESLSNAVVRLGHAIASSDSLTREQIRPILEQLLKSPELAEDLGRRLESTVALGLSDGGFTSGSPFPKKT